MKRAVLVGWVAVATLFGPAFSAPGQPSGTGPQNRPSAAQLLGVPVSGNPILTRVQPEIRNPYAGDPNAVVQGKKLFHGMNCDGCHAPLGGGGMGPPLSDREWIYGSEPAAIYLSIAQGRPNGMPSWSQALPPQTIWNLVSYIQTLSSAPPSTSDTLEKPAHPEHPTQSAQTGQDVFLSRCGVCHTVRGTDARGIMGPDLTHLMSRRWIAAGLLPNTVGNLAGWIADAQARKPGCFMPSLELPGPELQAVLAYLQTLR